ncbi:hypothetical protein LINGRAHAP2_LOCUS12756 [Linum grandiflorum]
MKTQFLPALLLLVLFIAITGNQIAGMDLQLPKFCPRGDLITTGGDCFKQICTRACVQRYGQTAQGQCENIAVYCRCYLPCPNY